MATTSLRHPIELLEAFEDNTEPRTRITTKTTPRQLKSIQTDLKEKLERMKLIFDSSIKAHEIKNEVKDTLDAEFKRTRRRICLSFLDATFRERYDDEFDDIKGSADFFNLLHQIKGEQSTDDEARDARKKLNEISRRTDENETFTRFFTRLEKIADTASKGNDVLKTHFLEESFNQNLTPDLRRYLLDQGKSSETPEKTADYLDKMKKYKRRIEIKAVSAEDILLREQVSALTQQFASFPDILRESLGTTLSSMIDAKMDSFRTEISNINKVKAAPRPTTTSSNGNQHSKSIEQQQAVDTTARFTRQERPNSQNIWNNFESRADGTPITCHSCGVKGHTKKNCRGTVVCHFCNQRGHVKSMCPRRMSKNE